MYLIELVRNKQEGKGSIGVCVNIIWNYCNEGRDMAVESVECL